jgi:polysaccharide export outer membrane protein
LIAGACLAIGCASGPKATETGAASEPYRLGPSDQLSIRVLPEPAIELTEVRVRPDGRISIELIGDVQAAGRTTDEVATEIAEKMTQYRQSPSVSVSVVTPASTTVSVLGEVKAPGSFALDRDIRVSEAVALAGGHTELGATSRVRVVRREASGTTLFLADLDRIKAGDGSSDVLLRRGDLVVVPAAYPVVAGYEIRKALYPLEVLFRTVGSSFFLLTAFQ